MSTTTRHTRAGSSRTLAIPSRIGSGRRRAALTLLTLVVTVALGGPASALAATTRPDAHDRSQALALAAKVKTFQDIAKANKEFGPSKIDKCPYLVKHPNAAFGAIFLILPALLADLVNQFKPELQDMQSTLAGLSPDNATFAKWAKANADNFAMILKFDNGGKKIDYCNYISLMFQKHTSIAAIKEATGLDPTLFTLIFNSNKNSSSSIVTKLNPAMRTFFIAAGVPKATAVAMTKSG